MHTWPAALVLLAQHSLSVTMLTCLRGESLPATAAVPHPSAAVRRPHRHR